MSDQRQMFLESLEGQAQWRDQKAAEYPGDERNKNSAAALRQLAKHLEAIPATDPLWLMYSQMWDTGNGDDSMRACEYEREDLRTFGFSNRPKEVSPEDAAMFLRDHVEALEEILADPDADLA
jgi:hypothetical protein